MQWNLELHYCLFLACYENLAWELQTLVCAGGEDISLRLLTLCLYSYSGRFFFPVLRGKCLKHQRFLTQKGTPE